MAAMNNYSIHLLPKSYDKPTWTQLVNQQKGLRLKALQTSPESFSSTYERESTFTFSDWEGRLKNPNAYTFVAVQLFDGEKGTEIPLEDVAKRDWVGTVVIVGPINAESEFGHFGIAGLFVLPEARGMGLGQRLVEVAVEHGKNVARERGLKHAMVQVSVKSGNGKVLKMYERLGFTVQEDEEGEIKLELSCVLQVTSTGS